MIKLSDRLELLAQEASGFETVADIGTDHGFLPISMWERGMCSRVILADVSEGSLQKAADNCRMLYPDGDFDLRLGDGFRILEYGEADTVVIAGMGGLLMIKIFEEDLDKTKSIKKLVLQPRISAGKLRYWLLTNGFSILTDTLVREGRFICNVISAVPFEGRSLPEIRCFTEDDIRMDIPSWQKNDPLFKELVNRRLEQEKKVLDSMEDAGRQWEDKKRTTIDNIRYLEELLADETI